VKMTASAAAIKSLPDPAEDTHQALIAQALATQGGHLFIGFNGFTLYFGRGAHLHEYDSEPMKEACLRAGLPVIDARALSFETLFSLVVLSPMTAVGEPPSPRPHHCLSYIPLEQTARTFKDAGAKVLNIAL
jgi:hypothetical protein